jgi:8-oxo-dGTP pyrophosphatase MutT (NUDIX family)
MAGSQAAEFPFPVPNVSAIIERRRGQLTEVLIQVRWKPERDLVYSGTFEIPAGGIGRHESVYDALKREVFEETGLRVTSFRPDVKTDMHSEVDDAVFAFVPFCCQQQLRGRARVGFVFVCTVAADEPVPGRGEVGEITWFDTASLKKLLRESPERIFIFQRPVLEFYLSQSGDCR